MSGKKNSLVSQRNSIVKSFDMYACEIQNWKFGSVLTTAYSLIQEKPVAELAIMQSYR